MQVHQDRFTQHTQVVYDPTWRRQPWGTGYPEGPDVPRPSSPDDMLVLAERLAADFDFVRVDLYCLNDRDTVFGEMTLAPGAGLHAFYPSGYDRRIGDLW